MFHRRLPRKNIFLEIFQHDDFNRVSYWFANVYVLQRAMGS